MRKTFSKQTVLPHIGIFPNQNTHHIPKDCDEQILVHMGCSAVASVEAFGIAFPYHIVIGGAVPAAGDIFIAAFATKKLICKQHVGMGGSDGLLQAALNLIKDLFCYDILVVVLDAYGGRQRPLARCSEAAVRPGGRG